MAAPKHSQDSQLSLLQTLIASFDGSDFSTASEKCASVDFESGAERPSSSLALGGTVVFFLVILGWSVTRARRKRFSYTSASQNESKT